VTLTEASTMEETMRFRLLFLCLAASLVLTIGYVSAQAPQPAEDLPMPSTQQLRAVGIGERDVFGFFGFEIARMVRGFQIAPVPLSLQGKNVPLVGLGSYLVNAGGGCNDCHTNPPFAPGGDPFKGEPKRFNAANYLAGGVSFGPFVSRNLTPEADTGKPEWTFDQFRQIMRTGIDLAQLHPQISPLLQVMPWPVYQSLTDRDLRAIYEYLSSIPHAEPGATPPTTSGPSQ
jgi:hypothetical protein